MRLILCRAGAALAALFLALPGGTAPKPGKKPAPKPAPAIAKKPAPAPGLRVLASEKAVEIDAAVAKRGYDDVLKGAIEYLLVSRGGKAYESVFETPVKAESLDAALRSLGLKPGGPPQAENAPPTGPGLLVEALWKDPGGAEQRVAVEELVLDTVAGKPLSGLRWTYTGSRMIEDPATNKKVLAAQLRNNLIATHREDATVLLMNPLPEANGKRYKRNEARLPKEGTPVRLRFTAP